MFRLVHIPMLIVGLIPGAVFIVALAAFMGWVTATVLRARRDLVWVDAVSAPISFVVAYCFAWSLRHHIRDPVSFGFGIVCVVPILHQVYRRFCDTSH
jgi:hypothetical protein